MRKVLLILAFSFVIFNSSFVIVHSQLQGQAKIDSLMKELPKAKPDSNKIKICISIAEYTSIIDPDFSLEYGFKALQLLNSNNWNLGSAQINNVLALSFIYLKQTDSSEKYMNIAIESIKNNNFKREEAKNYLVKALNLLENKNYEQAVEYCEKAKRIYSYMSDKSGQAYADFIKADILSFTDVASSLELLYSTLSYFEQQNDLVMTSEISERIGISMSSEGKYNTAKELILKSINIRYNLGFKSMISNPYITLGIIEFALGDTLKAIDYFHESIKINESINRRAKNGSNYLNIGVMYYYLLDFDNAIKYHFKGLEIFEEFKDTLSYAGTKGNIADIYHYFSLDSIIIKCKNKDYLLLNQNHHRSLAVKYIEEAIDIFKKIGKETEFYMFYRELYRISLSNGDYPKALYAIENFHKFKDFAESQETKIKIEDLESRQKNIKLETEKEKDKFRLYSILGISIFLLMAFVLAFIRFREKKKLSDKLALQNAEIEKQKNLVENQKNIVEEQKEILQGKNEQIYSSINYAATIQHAILPWDSIIKSAFSDILIFYKPKDIVSGDSYWYQEVDGIKFLAVIDCTGHGIPGAMLTVIASTALDDAVLGKRLSDTGQILTYMNEKVTEVLNQRLVENKIRDGMEVALIAIHQDKIQFSGAGRPLYLKNGTLEIIKTDKRGIAGQTDNDEYQFTAVEIEKAENLMLYLTSDGYADQMNEQSKKYSTKRFVALLDSISEKPISEQHEILEHEFSSHKGTRNQIDDVTILGVRI